MGKVFFTRLALNRSAQMRMRSGPITLIVASE